MIEYKEIKEFNKEEIKNLFESVKWESASFSERIVEGLKNSSVVISAWDNDRLVGLIRALDDGNTFACIHYFLVNPEYQGYHIGHELLTRLLDKYKDLLYIKVIAANKEVVSFYEKYGFKAYDYYTGLAIRNIDMFLKR